MTATQIIEQASADGVTLALSPSGSIKAMGEQDAINRWLAVIRDNKPGIVEALTASFTAWHWLVHFADRDPVEVYCNPDADLANIMWTYPDALAAVAIPERIPQVFTEAEDAEWEAQWLAVSGDDRITCAQCANLNGRPCLAARRGEIVASRNYQPIRDFPRRCAGYAPQKEQKD